MNQPRNTSVIHKGMNEPMHQVPDSGEYAGGLISKYGLLMLCVYIVILPRCIQNMHRVLQISGQVSKLLICLIAVCMLMFFEMPSMFFKIPSILPAYIIFYHVLSHLHFLKHDTFLILLLLTIGFLFWIDRKETPN